MPCPRGMACRQPCLPHVLPAGTQPASSRPCVGRASVFGPSFLPAPRGTSPLSSHCDWPQQLPSWLNKPFPLPSLPTALPALPVRSLPPPQHTPPPVYPCHRGPPAGPPPPPPVPGTLLRAVKVGPQAGSGRGRVAGRAGLRCGTPAPQRAHTHTHSRSGCRGGQRRPDVWGRQASTTKGRRLLCRRHHEPAAGEAHCRPPVTAWRRRRRR